MNSVVFCTEERGRNRGTFCTVVRGGGGRFCKKKKEKLLERIPHAFPWKKVQESAEERGRERSVPLPAALCLICLATC